MTECNDYEASPTANQPAFLRAARVWVIVVPISFAAISMVVCLYLFCQARVLRGP